MLYLALYHNGETFRAQCSLRTATLFVYVQEDHSVCVYNT